jgi:hypothetical protein
MLSIEEYKTLHEILEMTRASNSEAEIILRFIQRNIDVSAHICLHCGAQVRLAHNRVKGWYELNQAAIEIYSKCSKCNVLFKPTSKKNTICKNCK